MSKDSEGGAAFPQSGVASECRWEDRPEEGMTLKDYFAGQALAGLLSNPAVVDADTTTFFTGADLYARMAYRMAAAMLAEREKRREAAQKAKDEPQE